MRFSSATNPNKYQFSSNSFSYEIIKTIFVGQYSDCMSENIKVLVIANFDNEVVKKPEANIIKSIKEAGVDIDVMTFPGSPLKSFFENAGIKVIPHHPVKKVQWSSIKFIRKVIKTGKYDILHLFNSKSIPNGVFASLGLPVKVITYRGAKAQYWHDPTSYLTHYNPRVNGIICLSEYVKKTIIKQRVVSPKKLHVVWKGTDTDWFTGIKPEKYPFKNSEEKAFIVTCAANLRPEKGVDYLLKAAAYLNEYKNIHFVIIGNGTDSVGFNNKISKLPNSSQIHGIGYADNLHAHILAADIYVQPSISEGLCKSIIEAMALGKAVISTKSGGPEEYLVNNKNSLMVPVKDGKAIAKSILELYNNEKKREQLGINAKEFVKDNFSIKKSAFDTIKAYKAVLSGNKTGKK